MFIDPVDTKDPHNPTSQPGNVNQMILQFHSQSLELYTIEKQGCNQTFPFSQGKISADQNARKYQLVTKEFECNQRRDDIQSTLPQQNRLRLLMRTIDQSGNHQNTTHGKEKVS